MSVPSSSLPLGTSFLPASRAARGIRRRTAGSRPGSPIERTICGLWVNFVDEGDGEDGSLRTGPRVDDDYLTVAMLAAGLAGIFARRSGAGQSHASSDGLLPAAWRVAFTRLWWRCHGQGIPAPDGDLDLLALCGQPFAAWPVMLSLSAQDMQSCLLSGEELSAFGEQGARMAAADVEAEWTENRIYRALRAAAAVNGGEDGAEVERVYAVLRRQLIDHPVLTDRDLKRWEGEFPRTDGSGQTLVKRLVDEAYVPRPVSGVQQYLRCPGCRNTVPARHAACGTPGCPAGSAETVSVSAIAAIYEQHRATRRFIHDPGLVEARILDTLAGRKEFTGRIRVTPYPRLDTLDILVEFLATESGRVVVAETWGADAKDQESARLLGRVFRWPDSIACHRRFLVLPVHRMAQPGYVADLVAELDGRVDNVEVVGEKQLITMIAARVRRLAR